MGTLVYPECMIHDRIDPDKLKMFSFVLYSQLSGAVTAGMVHALRVDESAHLQFRFSRIESGGSDHVDITVRVRKLGFALGSAR